MQSALTGESLPVTKATGDVVFSGSICKQGEIEAIVIATGIHSFFGKAALLVDSTEVVGHFQKVKDQKKIKDEGYFSFLFKIVTLCQFSTLPFKVEDFLGN